MSLEIEVDIPIDTILAIQQAGKTDADAKALNKARNLAFGVLRHAVEKLPCEITAKPPSSEGDVTSASSSKRKNPSSTILRLSKKRKEPPKSFQIFVKDLTGKTNTYEVREDTTTADLAAMIHARIGIPVDEQRLIFAGKRIYGFDPDDDEERTLASYDIKKESTFHLVLSLKGS